MNVQQSQVRERPPPDDYSLHTMQHNVLKSQSNIFIIIIIMPETGGVIKTLNRGILDMALQITHGCRCYTSKHDSMSRICGLSLSLSTFTYNTTVRL